jgi:hypothetical protein
LAAPVINLQLRANYHSTENMNGSELKAKFAECMHVVGKWQLVISTYLMSHIAVSIMEMFQQFVSYLLTFYQNSLIFGLKFKNWVIQSKSALHPVTFCSTFPTSFNDFIAPIVIIIPHSINSQDEGELPRGDKLVSHSPLVSRRGV